MPQCDATCRISGVCGLMLSPRGHCDLAKANWGDLQGLSRLRMEVYSEASNDYILIQKFDGKEERALEFVD